MPRPETRDWLSVLRAAQTRGISQATLAEEEGVDPRAVRKALKRHRMQLPDGRATRWNEAGLLRGHLSKPV